MPAGARSRLARAFSSEHFTEGNRVRFHADASLALLTMLECIGGAKREILIEMYWFDRDQVGRKYAEALQRAAARGVDVHVLYDDFGSLSLRAGALDDLRAAGISTIAFRPLLPALWALRFSDIMTRNHRKLVAIDGEVAFVGGVNIADEWLAPSLGGAGWQDEVLQVHGPVVARLRAGFRRAYRSAGGSRLARLARSQPCGTCRVAVLAQHGLRGRANTLRTYLRRIRAASRTVLLANAYFVPTLRVKRALLAAARRGVRVRLLLSARSDVPLVRYASRATYGALLAAGVEIYEFRSSVLHSKTAVVDSEWLTVGSFNLDYISALRNRELNLSVESDELAQEVEAHFERWLTAENRIRLEDFEKRGRLARSLEGLAHGLRRWL